ncbi:hypothetical protein B0H16DRAFT_1570611 [Mycena metata]|uniref:Uncharacterized protein n=1 Tax=Mycena metata TaxID=1033252 RepID=A0AAD7MYR3_9AGAR|nr:hypothetical protein B0H16DRAFT_1570611 [Mycena metata]
MTTRRPPLPQRLRPSSQIYVGADSAYSSFLSNPPDLPDLPEPPSPGSSAGTGTSGLPSPPATNSTGSGSTGDPGSIAVRGGLNMLNGSNIKTFHAAFHSATAADDEQDEYDNDNDDDGEDNTARLDHQRRHSASENVLALQRVKSLTQRNKMALDKLSSFSRLSSPSPSTRPASATRSPHPPAPPSILASSSTSGSSSSHNNSTSTSSSSHSSSSRPSIRRARTQDHQSGSETERDDVPTPSPGRPTTPLPPTTRQRLVSAPASPQKHLTAAASSSSGSSTRSPRRSRVSNLSFSSNSRAGHDDDDDGPSSPEDITRAAMAAVASARRSPLGNTGTARYTGGTRMSPTSTTGSGKRRQPLPREWGAGSSNGRFSAEPPTSPPQHQTSPNKRHSLAGSSVSGVSSSASMSPRGHAHSNSTSSTSTIGSTAQGRASTVRELARKHQARWLSEDLGSNHTHSSAGGINGVEERERRQSLRAGSAESALGVRSLVGEGLRAAGLAGRGGGDVFSPPQSSQPERERTPARVEWAEGTRSRSQSRLGGAGGHGRAATSMADYSHTSPRREGYAYDTRDGDGDGGEPRTAPPLRTYRSSAYVLDAGAGTIARAGSALERYRGLSVERDAERDGRERDRERAYAPSPSPFGSVRRHGTGGGSGQQEHTKLMGDSLAMFEGHLARVAGGDRSPTELARSAQALVSAAERLNAILRAGTARALEEQIDAEVSGVDSGTATELTEVWRRVGGEYREGLRVSDELVRGVTGFLLGVGRVVRDFGEHRGSDEGRGSTSPDAVPGGRRSVESRRSWEAKDDRRISASGGRDSALGVRPSSVLRHDPAPPSAPRTATPSSRRLLTPREQRELNASASGIIASDSQQTIQQGGYDPSPTPASRRQNNQTTLDRSRTLPPISIPKPLPSLPSESTSTLRRNQTVGDKPLGMSQQRRRTLTSATVRAAGAGLLPSMTTPTTALTPHTVSNSPHEPRGDARMMFPVLPRSDSDKSATTRSRTNTVTFSRPSTVALAGLQMQHDRERQRTISGSNNALEEQRAASNAAAAAGPSGSGTKKGSPVAARDRPRMSLDGGVESSGQGGHAADRYAAAGLSVNPGQKRERRRTVTDIWPPSAS